MLLQTRPKRYLPKSGALCSTRVGGIGVKERLPADLPLLTRATLGCPSRLGPPALQYFSQEGRANRHLKNSSTALCLCQRDVCYALLRMAWSRQPAASKAAAESGGVFGLFAPWHDNFAALVSSVAGGRLAPRQCRKIQMADTLRSRRQAVSPVRRNQWGSKELRACDGPYKIWFESAA